MISETICREQINTNIGGADSKKEVSTTGGGINPFETEDGYVAPPNDGPYVRPENPQLSKHVVALLAKHKQLDNKFQGTSKAAKEQSAEKADAAFVNALAKLGVLDIQELGDALLLRPDGHAQAKGDDYIDEVVSVAIGAFTFDIADSKKAAADRKDEMRIRAALDVEVTHVRVIESDEPRYELTIDDKVVVFTVKQLMYPDSFAERVFMRLGRVPAVPPKSKLHVWRKIVNEWVATKQTEELPADAWSEVMEAKRLVRVIEELPPTNDAQAVAKDRRVWVEPNRKFFTTEAVCEMTSRANGGVPLASRDVCRHLARMGAVFGEHSVGAERIECWLLQLATPRADTTNGADLTTAEPIESDNIDFSVQGSP